MACYSPLEAWYAKEVNPSGKRSLVFTPQYAYEPDNPISVACGQCIGCRLEKSRQWAIRCMHEASLHEDNCFITLTFSPEELMKRENEWSLDVREFQLFMKRLRKKYGNGIRYFHCGEYGENGNRPHYHACLFNFDFPDKELYKEVDDYKLYVSKSLEEMWPYGFSTIGQVTFESAAYTARYIMKKVTGEKAEEHYQWADSETGEVRPLKPEYVTMSRRPGIGKEWLNQFKSDMYPSDFITVRGKKCKPPKFYDKQLEKEDPFLYDEIKEKRLVKIYDHLEDLTYERLQVREKVAEMRVNQLVRNHDKE